MTAKLEALRTATKDMTISQRGSKFLILTGKTDLFADYTNEWFPVFAERSSNTTVQGYD